MSSLNPMNFTDNQYGNEILDKLKNQRDGNRYCDVLLFINNKSIKAHRSVLASCSTYFEALFKPKQTMVERFSVSCDDIETFQHFITYMYTGSVVLNMNNIFTMFKLSHHFGVFKLKMYCSEYLERYLDVTNCLAVKYLADFYSVDSLSKLAEGYFQTHINDILSQNLFLELDVYQMECFLGSRCLPLEGHQMLELIFQWLKHDVTVREKQVWILLKQINWKESNIELGPSHEQLLTSSEITLYSILHTQVSNGCLPMKYESIYQSLHSKYTPSVFQEKISIVVNKKRKKKLNLVKSSPFVRLAALRRALLRRRKNCNKKFQPKRDAKIETEPESLLKCHLCEYYAGDPTTLEQHLSAVHSRDVTYKCGVCGFVCQWNNTYFQHMAEHFPGPPFKCDSCDFTNEKLNAVLTHRSIHVDEKLHRCSQCGFRTRSQSSFNSHMKHHQIQSAAMVERTPDKTSDRTYVCDLCGFSSKYLSHLIAHKRIHSGDVYRCSYPHCKYTTAKKSQLGSHAKSHQGVRPHCCSICGRGFLEKSHLVRHERIHLEEKPFKCEECDYASSRRDKLKEHQARHHGDNASAKVPYKARPNKKPTPLFGESFSSNETSTRQQTSTGTGPDLPEVISTHTLTSNNAGNINYQAVFTEHHPVSGASLEFHHQQILTTANNRVKEHSVTPGSSGGHRGPPQSSAAAVAAAMMLDPRFHHANAASGPYASPAVTMATMVGQTAGQGVQASHHQVPEYPSALMSLF